MTDLAGHEGSSRFRVNYNDAGITCQRDLEDFARLWICDMPALSNAYSVTLSMNALSGNPAVDLVNAVETNGGTLYLTVSNTAYAQVYDAYGIGPGQKYRTISATNSLTLPANLFTNAGNKYFLFEGAGIGSGELVLTVSLGTNIIAQTGAWLDLHDVRDFYERAVITNNTSGEKSNWTSTVETVVNPQLPDAGGSQDLVVLVHGINVRPWDCLQQGDTVFKRLYWSGYQGKFATVKWPCNLLTPIPNPLSPAVFNDSEFQGYKASQALTTYLSQLRARLPDYQLHLLVHSQGNAVVSEAIRGGLTFDTYILTQGALPASAYDVDAPVNNGIASYENSRMTPEWLPMGYHGLYTNFTGRIVNFYNPHDGVLDWWVRNQKILKPSIYFDTSYYRYDGTNSYYYPLIGSNYQVTDSEESRAEVSRSRTLPIGQSGPASTHGVIQSAVDLNAQFGFNDAMAEHSAQWTRSIQACWGYYDETLNACLIPTIQR
jgi:hypothetical protein